jgi:hypothetical protein
VHCLLGDGNLFTVFVALSCGDPKDILAAAHRLQRQLVADAFKGSQGCRGALIDLLAYFPLRRIVIAVGLLTARSDGGLRRAVGPDVRPKL